MLIEPASSHLVSDKGKYSMGHNVVDSPPDYTENGHMYTAPLPPLPPTQPPKPSLDGVREPAYQTAPHKPHRPSHPLPTTDQVHIFEPDGNIQGTFHIDPSIQALDQSHRKGSKGKSKEQPPHASFRSRKGTINLELGTTGSIAQTPKGNVSVSSRSGDITINLLPMHSSRPRIGLETTSRSGNIVLFLPRNFVGVVHLSNRKGQLLILPALQSISRMVKNSEKEVIFMIGGHEDASDLSREASFCQANTRTGSIIIGLSGQDHYAPEVGFWKKLGKFFRGGSQPK
ncbi:hypothetical protein CVT24_007860 [Panaeolus cyanescens]|uniref:DUF7330 domain-containing protein n=1 Tax=Panaeolus cyanescens TaxID=181874 RepID=A0A409VCF8_9AGAR|nr:hypothetical protein CVT24_007860 [Panaeolus cyanescens]